MHIIIVDDEPVSLRMLKQIVGKLPIASNCSANWHLR